MRAEYEIERVEDLASIRVLVVDDENAIRHLLTVGLGQAGFAVRTAVDGAAAMRAIGEWRPDAIVLDVMLPQVDGLALLPHLRRITEAPVLILSAKDEPSDKVEGLIRGADDYIAKPFDMRELVARIHAVLRRPRSENREILVCADVRMDVAGRTVTRAGGALELSPREFDLLELLLRNAGRVLDRSTILDRVWSIEADVSSSIVDTYVSYLRAKIDAPFDRKLLHTVRGVGYALRDELA